MHIGTNVPELVFRPQACYDTMLFVCVGTIVPGSHRPGPLISRIALRRPPAISAAVANRMHIPTNGRSTHPTLGRTSGAAGGSERSDEHGTAGKGGGHNPPTKKD